MIVLQYYYHWTRQIYMENLLVKIFFPLGGIIKKICQLKIIIVPVEKIRKIHIYSYSFRISS